jgi:DNA-binding transcriptional regulator YiaG
MPVNNYRTLADTARKQTNLSNDEWCTAMGMRYQDYCKWQAGQKPNHTLAVILSQIIGISAALIEADA